MRGSAMACTVCALVCGLGLGCGRERERAGEARPGGQPDGAGEDAALFSGEVLSLQLKLAPSAMAELAREPHEYVEGSFAFRGVALARVGVRFKGHRSLRKWSSKPAFKLDFDKYTKGQTLLGLRSLVLNNMVDDPTMAREALGYEVFRALGTPAPRTGYAELNVNGQRFGLYTVLEPPDAPFLARHFERDDGPLYEGEYGCDLEPDHVAELGLEHGDDRDRSSLRALVEAADGPIAAMLDGEHAPLDPERFFAFLAAGAWLADFDGYRHAHNYRLYYDPGARRWSLMPWGLDRVLERDMSVFDSHERLASKCFADRDCRLRYIKALHAALPRIDALDLPARFERILARIDKVVARDSRRPYDDEARARKLEQTRAWLAGRSARVREQIACWDGSAERDGDRDGFGCSDCDDRDDRVHPGATEACNQRDDDCSGVADDAASCPCPEQAIAGARFALCDRAVSWSRAAELCAAQGARLAHFDSREQSRALGRAARALRESEWWIGLSDREREGQRSWHGGIKASLRDWASGEPDDYACAQDCVAIEKDDGGRWRDMSCATPQPFVCRLP
ncbi:MAG TPA: CotH kinase family protein [Polyangiales bacterium]|nr:CotH kinase family protein [Polyangiales bacterium]